jgi:hypothetical protein
MRKPDRFHTAAFITANGGHVPAALNRLAAEAGESADIYGRIAARVAKLVPIIDLEVDIDEVRQILTLMVSEQDGSKLPAASLSDGTLRFLTLAALVADPSAERLICIEEPENGIHPAKMKDMMDLLRDLGHFTKPGAQSTESPQSVWPPPTTTTTRRSHRQSQRKIAGSSHSGLRIERPTARKVPPRLSKPAAPIASKTAHRWRPP